MKTTQPRKQRKKLLSKGHFHKLKKTVGAHLSKTLREKYKKRSLSVVKEDEVKVLRGKFKGKTGLIEKVNLKKRRIYIEGIQVTKADGTKAKVGIQPSNVIITKLNLKDKKRKAKIEGKATKEEAKA